jgi:hypothetical protein
MRRAAIIFCVATLALLGLGLAYGQRLAVLGALLFAHAPRTAFDAQAAPPAPDYSQRSAWAVYGGDVSSGPAGVSEPDPASRNADVFFIHPTTYFSNDNWNQPLNDAATNKRTDDGPIRNQASGFQLCCRIYAPRYRQMTFGGFLHYSDNSKEAMDLAYSDIKRAFEYYLAHENHGRPFIIASHSQGSRHARRLIEEVIDGTPLAKQMVAAYVVGTWLDADWFARLKTVRPCQTATDTGCVLTWSTLAQGSDAQTQREGFAKREGRPPSFASRKFICTNPLTWSQSGGAQAPAALNLGGWVYGSGNKPRPIDPHLVSARCDNGALFVSEAPGFVYHAVILPGGNYHNYDYQLFYMNIRQNAADRVSAFLAARP